MISMEVRNMNKQHIMNVVKRYIHSLAEMMQEDIAQARQEWTEAGCPSDNQWSIDLTIDSIVADYRRDMYGYINRVVEAYDLTEAQAAELEKEVA